MRSMRGAPASDPRLCQANCARPSQPRRVRVLVPSHYPAPPLPITLPHLPSATLRELAVDLLPPADTIHAPSPSTDDPTPRLDLERVIGELMFTAVCAVAQGVGDMEDGGLAPETTLAGADVIARLFALRQECAGAIDFDVVARAYGKQVLRARYHALRPHDELTDEMLDEMVSWPLDILGRVVKARIN